MIILMHLALSWKFLEIMLCHPICNWLYQIKSLEEEGTPLWKNWGFHLIKLVQGSLGLSLRTLWLSKTLLRTHTYTWASFSTFDPESDLNLPGTHWVSQNPRCISWHTATGLTIWTCISCSFPSLSACACLFVVRVHARISLVGVYDVSMCVCVCVYMYVCGVCRRVCVYLCVCECVRACMRVCVCAHVYMLSCVYMCRHVCLPACL